MGLAQVTEHYQGGEEPGALMWGSGHLALYCLATSSHSPGKFHVTLTTAGEGTARLVWSLGHRFGT